MKETYAGVSAGDFDFTAGRKMVLLGHGIRVQRRWRARSATHPTNPSDRLNVNEGRDMVKADWVHGSHAFRPRWSTAALAPANGEPARHHRVPV